MSSVFQGDTYAAEIESGYLTIHRWSDQRSVTRRASGIVGDFRSCVRSHGVDRACSTYLRIWKPDPSDWVQLYKCDLQTALDLAREVETLEAEERA